MPLPANTLARFVHTLFPKTINLFVLLIYVQTFMYNGYVYTSMYSPHTLAPFCCSFSPKTIDLIFIVDSN